MNFLFFLFNGLSFISPPFLYPTGIYLSGDPDIIAIADGSQRKQEYRAPRDLVGAQVEVKLSDDSLLYIYMNRDKNSFYKVMNPPVNEFTEDKMGLISLNDEKLIIIFHQYLLKTVSNMNEWSLGKTIDFINILDKAVHTRSKSLKGNKMLKKELREIKVKIEEAKENGDFDNMQTTASISARMTESQALSGASSSD